MKSLFIMLLKKGDSVVTSKDIYKLYPKLKESAVQAKIKRCLKSGEIKRMFKGVYTLSQDLIRKPIAEEAVAQAIDESAFLSGLGALRFYNLIPEIVNYKTFLGTKSAKVDAGNIHFEIKKLPDDQVTFGVDSIPVSGGSIRVADPVRAIMDTLIEQKLAPKNRNQICSFLRIDEDEAAGIAWDKAPSYAYKFRNNRLAKVIASAMMKTAEA